MSDYGEKKNYEFTITEYDSGEQLCEDQSVLSEMSFSDKYFRSSVSIDVICMFVSFTKEIREPTVY